VIDSITQKLNKSYIYPEIAGKMNEALTAQVKKRNYDQITDPTTFAAKNCGKIW
jgi:hypothetical protein